MSGIGITGIHDVVWYRKQLSLPEEYAGKRILLHFGAVDYLTRVWVNGIFVVLHEGGHTPFSVDITDQLQDGNNSIVVKAQDFSRDPALPKGKQAWLEHPAGIRYTRTTGIWQTAWLEPLADIYLDKVKLTPDLETNEIKIRAFLKGSLLHGNYGLRTIISFDGIKIAQETVEVWRHEVILRISLQEDDEHSVNRKWTPEEPNLYDISFELLKGDDVADKVQSYFGMRKISVEEGQVCLNNRPYYMKLVLDQGIINYNNNNFIHVSNGYN